MILFKNTPPDDINSADLSITAGVRRLQVMGVVRFVYKVKVSMDMFCITVHDVDCALFNHVEFCC